MKNQVLSIEQMQKLKELGVDPSKASMVLLFQDDESNIYDWDEVVEECSEFGDCFHHFVKDDEGNNNRVYMSLLDAERGNYDHSYREDCTVFTLQDIIELLPKQLPPVDFGYNCFVVTPNSGLTGYVFHYDDIADGEIYKQIYSEKILDAAYEMLVWVAENGYLTSK